jgi:Tfp pilus assembly protein PilN
MSAGVLPDPTTEGMIPQGLPFLEMAVATPAPRVNLLPVEILEQRAIRRLAVGLAGAVAACAVLVGAGYAYAGSGEAQAHHDLSAAQVTQSRLQDQQRALAPAKMAQTQIQAAQSALAAAMGNEVLWSRYLDQLRVQRPEGVRFSSVALAPSGAAGSSGATGAGGATPTGGASAATTPGTAAAAPGSAGLATLTVVGKARSQPDVAALLDRLAGIKGFTGVYLSSTSSDDKGGPVTFTVTATVTSDALSHRYTGDGS